MPLVKQRPFNLKGNTPDAKIIFLDNFIRPEQYDFPEDTPERYFQTICYNVISGPGWYRPAFDQGFPNPFDMAVWYDNIYPTETWYDTTNLTFAECTDLRAGTLREQFAKDELPIVISYSGGIDSAAIVVAAIRNWDKEMLDRIVIRMNNLSYFESPTFFRDIIQKYKFKITNDIIYDWENSHYIAGEPGDAIWITSAIVELGVLYKNSHQFSVRTQAGPLIEWLTGAFQDNRNAAIWYYNTLLENAKINGFEIETYEDFFWWAKTNFAYGANRLNMINHIANPWHEGSFDNFLKRGIAWYHTHEYRTWAKTNRNNGVKFDGTISSYKMPAKKYINDMLQDPYYLKYKVKVNSSYSRAGKVLALFNDGTLIMQKGNIWDTSNI